MLRLISIEVTGKFVNAIFMFCRILGFEVCYIHEQKFAINYTHGILLNKNINSYIARIFAVVLT